MPARKVARRSRRKIAVGDLRTDVDVLKAVTATTLDGPQRTLVRQFGVRAKEESLAFGKHGHDGVNIEKVPTHIFTVRYRADITAERILERGGVRFKILEIENLEGRNEYLVMRCRELGADDKEATKA